VSPADAETLVAAGLLRVVWRYGDRAGYALTKLGAALLRDPNEPRPCAPLKDDGPPVPHWTKATRENRPSWAYLK